MNDGDGTLPGAVARVSQTLIGALPPAFVLLLLINLIFLGLVMWFIDDQIQQRTELVEKVIERCLVKP